ncbi:MAG: HAD family hydrolase [Gloeomargaritaceae cyanobacterium C42_A2020_066]|nr:HAD family hydrolase [Gloeomargaritaceae cyanobacterium C42_A2020_066]
MTAGLRARDVVFPRIAVIFWDKDGTLTDARAYWMEVGRRRVAWLAERVPGIETQLNAILGLTVEGLNPQGLLAVGSRHETEVATAAGLAAVGYDWLTALALVQEGFTTVAAQMVPQPLIPAARPLLEELAQRGVRQAILSADTPAQVEAFVRHNRLEPLLAGYWGVRDGPNKPHPSLVTAACTVLGVSPAQTLIIGDAPVDMIMARAAGTAGGVGVTWGLHPAARLHQATVCVAHWGELVPLA